MFDMFRNIYVLQCIRKKSYAFEILRCNEENNYSRMMKNAMADSILSTSLFAQSVSPRSIFTVFIYIRS